jgi:hypothetical protein
METQITAQNNTIQANFIASETNNFNNSAAAYNSSVTAINNIWNKFNGGITTIGNTSNWTPESGIDFTNNQNLPQASQWTYTNDESTYDMSLETAAMGGFQTQPNGSIAAPDPSITSTYQNVLAANLQLFQANEFKNSYGSLINSTPGFNVANDIRAYNANVAQYYYEGLKQIHYLYVIQKTANILNYQAESAGYAGPLSSFNGLSFNYSSGAAVESSNTTVFLQKQENLDAWAVGASNMLFQNTMQYIISDTPFQNQLGYNPPQPSYPYGAIESVQQYFTNTIFPNTVQTQSLWGLENNSGGMPQIQSANGVTSKNFVFYVESSIGNPYQYIPQYESAWENGQTMTISSKSTSIFATGPNGQEIPGYIANPGLYDGQNYQVWAINTAGGITQTALTNLNNRCSNGGSSLVSWTDWGNQGGNNYPPRTWGWSCPTSPNSNYVNNSIAPLYSSQEAQNINGSYYVFGLMSPQTESFLSVVKYTGPGDVAIVNSAITNFTNGSTLTYTFTVYNTVMNVGGYEFNPTFIYNADAQQAQGTYAGNVYCGPNDPLCTIDLVTGNICLAGQVAGLNWVNQGTLMFGAYVPGTNNQQHCYNS